MVDHKQIKQTKTINIIIFCQLQHIFKYKIPKVILCTGVHASVLHVLIILCLNIFMLHTM